MSKRQFWQRPSLRDDEEHGRHRPVTWLELFLDLFVVVLVAKLAHPLHEAHSWHDLGTFVAQFSLLFWVWIGLTFYQERFETDGLENRVILFVFMLGISGMGAFAHDGLGHNWAGYVGSYSMIRVFTVLLWVRSGIHEPRFRGVATRYSLFFGIGQIAAISSIWWVEARTYLLVIAVMLEVATPLTILGHNKRLPRVSSSKHPERFGLFTLIVLGEAVAGVVSGLHDLELKDYPEITRAVLALLVGLGLWWVYFDFVGRRPFKPLPPAMYAWAYLHYALFQIIVIGGIAMSSIVVGHAHAFQDQLGGIAVGAFLAVCGLLELVLARKPDEPTHPVSSPALKLGFAPIVAASGFVTTGVAQLVWIFVGLAVQMIYGLWVWFSQDVPEQQQHTH